MPVKGGMRIIAQSSFLEAARDTAADKRVR